MKAAVFSIVPYAGQHSGHGWPVPADGYSAEAAQESMERALAQFELADQLGFDWVTVAEHHYSAASLTPNPMVMAAAVAQRVKHAKIALLGSNIPIQNPVRVAEEFAMLDTLSGGRLIAGMLRGTSNEYATYGVNPAESRERFMEALELIVRAWTEPQPFGWLGRYYEYRTISIWPRPVQTPHPPIFMSISSPEAAEFAAAKRISGGLAVTTLDRARESVRVYREAAGAHGWEPAPEQLLYRIAVHVAESDALAREDWAPFAGAHGHAGGLRLSTGNPAADEAAARAGYYGRDTPRQRSRLHAGGDIDERIESAQLMLGSPETVLGQVDRLRGELGVGILELIFIAPRPDAARRSLELFGTRVLPRMREL
ncbi:MAG TPA: LLM class flavin-dependent oxidoreductase [Solirubrobacteraceae bacterium]|nr:LLM class flavin-dependent oxidoreductase [Solirubrobacteraceae bacterium]